jgi:hypothetical protein
MHRTGQLGVAVLLTLSTVACQTAPVAQSPSATEAPTQPVATPGSTPSGATASPSATPLPPATTAFAAPVDTSRKGRLRLATTLTADGTAVVNAPVSVAITALDPTYQVLTLKGVVPVGTKSVIVQLGVNRDGTGPGSANFRIYRITYGDAGTGNRLPNSGFDSGLFQYAVYGSGSVTTPTSDRGDGRMLRIKAKPTQDVLINTYGIPGTPETGYKLTIAAVVPPAGATTGHIAAIFLKKIEFWRDTMNLVAPPISPMSLTTDANGSISIDTRLPAGRYSVVTTYVGNTAHSAAMVQQRVTVP